MEVEIVEDMNKGVNLNHLKKKENDNEGDKVGKSGKENSTENE